MRTGIIGAMENEVEQLKEKMTQVEIVEKAKMTFCSGLLCGAQVVVVRSGVGKVNAAVCTQILADDFGVDYVINTGIAGSLDAAIDIGDIVISDDVLHHDMDATGFGYPVGQIPLMEEFSFVSDRELGDIAQEVCGIVNPEIHVFRGRIVSGDQFISDRDTKNRIHETFGGYCTEMEGAAIAQTAYLNGIPFIIVRAISDKADNSAYMDYESFEEKAVLQSVQLICGLMERLK